MNLLKKLQSIVLGWQPDNGEATSYPFWFVASKAGLGRGLIIESNGVWFSREAAEDHLKNKRHRYSKNAFVWCASGHMSTQLRSVYDSLQSIDLDVATALNSAMDWARATFPDSTPEAKFAHLKKELIELEGNLGDAHEIADCVILLAGIADLQGIDLGEAIAAKLEILKDRSWGKPDSEGVIEHIREAA